MTIAEHEPLAQSNPSRFVHLIEVASENTGLPNAQIVHDYHLHRTLYGLTQTHPCDQAIVDSNDGSIVIGRSWAFAGGTALASAHRIIERFSEDIDLVVFVDPSVGRSPLDRTLRRGFLPAAARAADPNPENHRIPGSGSVATANVQISDEAVIRIDASTMAPRPGKANPDVVPIQVCSLMGRYADPGDLELHPELGGFEVHSLAVHVTAANKLATLHQAATSERLDQLRARGRDLYDLACIAQHPDHSISVSENVAAIADHTLRTARTRRGGAERPDAGYSTSLVFDPRTPAGEALRDGYQQMQPMIFGDYRPSFEEALARARRLD